MSWKQLSISLNLLKKPIKSILNMRKMKSFARQNLAGQQYNLISLLPFSCATSPPTLYHPSAPCKSTLPSIFYDHYKGLSFQ